MREGLVDSRGEEERDVRREKKKKQKGKKKINRKTARVLGTASDNSEAIGRKVTAHDLRLMTDEKFGFWNWFWFSSWISLGCS